MGSAWPRIIAEMEGSICAYAGEVIMGNTVIVMVATGMLEREPEACIQNS